MVNQIFLDLVAAPLFCSLVSQVPCVKFASANCTFATVSGSGEAALWKAEPMAASPNAKGTDEEEPFKHSEVYATFFLMCNTSADARISDVSAKTKPSDAGLYALPGKPVVADTFPFRLGIRLIK